MAASNVTATSAVLHSTGHCDRGETCTWYWEYWPASQPRSSSAKSPVYGPVHGPTGDVALSERITGLQPHTAYRWVFCASPNDGRTYGCVGPNGDFGSTTADPPPDYGTFSTAGWSIVPSPNATAPGGSFSAVSCSAGTACAAVGSTTGSAGNGVTLAETWNGTAWAVQPAPTPANTRSGYLSGVSCTSASACTAVGDYIMNGTGYAATLGERWDGTGWTVQPTPNPGGGRESLLKAVSCTSASACTAVGDYTDSAGDLVTLAERWDGNTWTVQTTPNPTGALDSFLNGVSCTSATSCTAVGSFITSARTLVTLAETWNGTSWTIQATPTPTGAQNSSLSGVSCTSATSCTAVGNYTNSGGTEVTLAETWNGTTWTAQTTPNPTGTSASLSGTSCTSGTACTAVGSYVSSSGIYMMLAERWDGSKWTIQATPNPSNAPNFLYGVSCTSTTGCTAVGYYNGSGGDQLTLAVRWDGTNWTIQSTPDPSGGRESSLSGASCTAPAACTAVGYYVNTTGHQLMLAERWDGVAWTVQTTPNPTGAQFSSLSGVSCTSATACTAVGSYANSAGLTLAERWNGTTWTVQPTPNPTGTSPSLYGVSCTSATACIAVGSYIDSTGNRVTLAERWDGTNWTIQPTPSPSGGGDSFLSGVSCTSATACTAVGYASKYDSGHVIFEVTLAERWDGTAWTIQSTANPTAVQDTLSSVSCISATACTAVGHSLGTLAERWNGTTWTIQSTPNLQAPLDTLSSVSCASATACTAVGTSGAGVTLAERWDGTAWTIEPTPNPTGDEPSLLGLSCTSATACAAVGWYLSSVGMVVTLAERYSN
jgi:hypothetical protein